MYLPSEQFPHQNSKTKNISLVVIRFVLYDLQYNIEEFVRTAGGQIVYWKALFLSSFLLQASDHLEGMFQILHHCNIL
jgi:hypothetical protein